MEALQDRLAPIIVRSADCLRRTVLVGLAGPQGSGKSTVAAALPAVLEAQGVRTAIVSLDDFYLPRAAREVLGSRIHPLLVTRGPPGTHEVARIEQVVERLLAGGTPALPRFDKATDDRSAETVVIPEPVDVILFEGWCVGARPQAPGELSEPVNDLERRSDPDGSWRGFVNDALGAYQPLFGKIDLLIQLRAPDFETVAGWRWEQEARLRAEHGGGPGVMTRAQVDRFVQHYERITRHMMMEMGSRADVVVDLAADREVAGLRIAERFSNP